MPKNQSGSILGDGQDARDGELCRRRCGSLSFNVFDLVWRHAVRVGPGGALVVKRYLPDIQSLILVANLHAKMRADFAAMKSASTQT